MGSGGKFRATGDAAGEVAGSALRGSACQGMGMCP